MSEQIRTFGRVSLEIDKMAGLRFNLRDPASQVGSGLLSVAHWDSPVENDVNGELTDNAENVLWRGVVMTAAEIQQIFKPFREEDLPTTYARRPGSLGKPKTVGVLRLETADAVNFSLMKCGGGEQRLEEVCRIVSPEVVNLRLRVEHLMLNVLMFDKNRFANRLQRL
jgi:hypothetical protein